MKDKVVVIDDDGLVEMKRKMCMECEAESWNGQRQRDFPTKNIKFCENIFFMFFFFIKPEDKATNNPSSKK